MARIIGVRPHESRVVFQPCGCVLPMPWSSVVVGWTDGLPIYMRIHEMKYDDDVPLCPVCASSYGGSPASTKLAAIENHIVGIGGFTEAHTVWEATR